MSHTKIYPAQDPNHEIANGTVAQTFNGCSRALLTTENINAIECCLERLTHIEGYDEIINLVIEAVGDALDEGQARMNSLHSLLGAYDVDADSGSLVKPDSELKKHHPGVPNIRSLIANLADENKDGAA